MSMLQFHRNLGIAMPTQMPVCEEREGREGVHSREGGKEKSHKTRPCGLKASDKTHRVLWFLTFSGLMLDSDIAFEVDCFAAV